jgi:hypothetical protein
MAVRTRRTESRVIPVLVVVMLVMLDMFLPSRYTVLPYGSAFVFGGALIAAMLLAGATGPGSPWMKVERYTTYVLVVIVVLQELVILKRLTSDIVFHQMNLGAISLLATAVGVWTGNVVVFAFIYWQLDRGGPEGRANGWQGWADFTFARGDASDGMPADWQPTFADYLFVAFTTSTAFSPTDTLPLTRRAKMLMLLEALVALVALLIVAARAINTLG